MVSFVITPFTGIGGFIAQQLEEQLFRWLRAAELTCDRAALLVARDPKVDIIEFKFISSDILVILLI